MYNTNYDYMTTFKKLAALMLVFTAGMITLVSCDKEKDNDSSKSFTLTANLPEDTAESDAVYIVGEFNGGVEYALGNPKWELKGTATKRSITIDPKDYVGGKTINDYWCIQSPTRGVEVVSPGVPMIRQGKSTEINVVAWDKAAGPSFDPSGTWRLVGTMNNWDAKVGIDMTQEGTAWVAKGIHLKADDQFKFVMDHSWATNFGAGEPGTTFTAELNEEFDLQADGGNIKAANGYYDIYLYPFEAKAKLVDGGDEPGPDPKPVTGITVDPGVLTLKVGESQTLTLTITPADADVQSVEWKVDDASIATVSQEGEVNAVAAGETIITVFVDGFNASCAVTVTSDEPGPGPEPPADPAILYAYDGNAWGSMMLYVWRDSGELTAWPGMASEGTEEVYGHTFYKFSVPAEFCSDTESLNVIFNNGVSGQTADLSFDIAAGQTYYFHVVDRNAVIIDPENFDPGSGPDPGAGNATLYVHNSRGWENIYLWAWGSYGNIFESWPGLLLDVTEEIEGETYYKYTIEGQHLNREMGIVVSDGNGTQSVDGYFTPQADGRYFVYVWEETDANGHHLLEIVSK